jgi:cell surface protein SprA
MIGVRNPIKTRSRTTDNGTPKYAEVWVDELRLSDFIEDGGWAANGHLQTRLADLGTVDIVGQASTPGWGSIEQKVNERSKDQTMKYDISSSVELGKFFPEKMGVRLPVYVGYSESRIRPQFNPLDPDILLSDALKAAKNQTVRDSILSISEDYSRRKTITVSNAGITKRSGKPHPWDLANLSVNYTYNEIFNSNVNTQIDLEKDYKGGLNYDFQGQPANVMPFKNVKFLNAPVFKIIKDFNFYVFPKSLSFRTDLTRDYNELITRNIDDPYLKITPSFKKDFEWSRIYDFKFDITRQLKFDFTATDLARIDEPPGGVDKSRYSSLYDAWKDSVWVNLSRGGRTTNYNHFLNVTYTLPVNKLPLLSWVNANARYSSDYTWLAGPIFPDSLNINLGNSIKNHSEMTFTAMGNLATLYTKLKFLKKIENITQPGSAQKMKADMKTVTYSKDNVSFKANVVKAIFHNLNTKDVKVKVVGKHGEELKGKLDIVSENKVNFTAAKQIDSAKVVIEGQVRKSRNPLVVTGEYLLRALMGIRSVSLSYTTSQGQFLPGYTPETNFLGMSTVNDKLAPGWPFILGYSDKGFFDRAVTNGWLSKDTLLNTPAVYDSKRDLSFQSLVEPFPGLRININADRRFIESESSYYIADNNGNFPDSTRNRIINGNFSISIISWGTSFEKISKNNDYVSPTFEAFKRNTIIISERLAAQRQKIDPGYDPSSDPVTGLPISGPYKSGYGETSSDVLIPAFLAAYTKSNPNNIGLGIFPSALRMMPNWRINFDGLSKFEFIQSTFRSINLMHQYQSTYQIGAYTTNLSYDPDEDGISRIRDLQSNFVQQYEIDVVTISEQFSPLINVDMNWKNSLTTRFEWKKSRTVSLNMTSNQVSDARINELVFGAGYRFDNVQIILKTGQGQRKLKSDLNLRLDLSIRDNKEIARKLIEDVDQPVVGEKVVTLGVTADYVLSDRFNLQVFTDRTMNNPFVANTFPTSNTNFGFSLKFTLAQ